MNLTFGEQIKILLDREEQSIQAFADLIGECTGIHVSQEDLALKLKHQNFQEQDMRALAAILGYKVHISLEPASKEEVAAELTSFQISGNETPKTVPVPDTVPPTPSPSDSTEVSSFPETHSDTVSSLEKAPLLTEDAGLNAMLSDARSITAILRKRPSSISQSRQETIASSESPELPPECVNPYNGKEYLPNTVRKHPQMEHYIQVYDQLDHIWVDVAEDYFLKFQEQKRQMMGKDYSQPIYI